jgi:hypothetical protein
MPVIPALGKLRQEDHDGHTGVNQKRLQKSELLNAFG